MTCRYHLPSSAMDVRPHHHSVADLRPLSISMNLATRRRRTLLWLPWKLTGRRLMPATTLLLGTDLVVVLRVTRTSFSTMALLPLDPRI